MIDAEKIFNEAINVEKLSNYKADLIKQVEDNLPNVEDGDQKSYLQSIFTRLKSDEKIDPSDILEKLKDFKNAG